MMATRMCPECNHEFSPPSEGAEVQCPQCGALQHLESEGPTQAQSELDQPITRPSVEVPPISSPRREDRTPPEGQVSGQKVLQEGLFEKSQDAPNFTSSHPTIHQHIRTSHFRRVVNALGPTLLVCILFVSWFSYDKLIRQQPHQQALTLLTQALKAYRSGDLRTAKSRAEQALLLDPQMTLGPELILLIEKGSIEKSSEMPQEMDTP